MPRREWKKSELVEGLKPYHGALICEFDGLRGLVRDESVLEVAKWVDSLNPVQKRLLPCLIGEWTHAEAATALGMKQRTIQRRVQALRAEARTVLEKTAM